MVIMQLHSCKSPHGTLSTREKQAQKMFGVHEILSRVQRHPAQTALHIQAVFSRKENCIKYKLVHTLFSSQRRREQGQGVSH